MFSVKDKIVVITGTRTGIGKALCEGFFERGAIVCPIERSNCDIRSYEQIDRFIDGVGSEHGKIDVLINNAGTTDIDVIKTNLFAAAYLSKVVSKYMGDGGSIINVTSIASMFGMTDNIEYGMAKGGLRILTKCLAIDLAPIRVNNLCPGYFKTKMTEKSYSDSKKRKQREERIIMKRFGDPEDLLGAAIFLASEASKYITGIDLVVDGGFSCYGI